MKAGDVVRCVRTSDFFMRPSGYGPAVLVGDVGRATFVNEDVLDFRGRRMQVEWFEPFTVSEVGLRDVLEEAHPLVISEAAAVVAGWLRARGVEVEEAPSETVTVELPRSVAERCAADDGDRLVGPQIAAACAAALGEDR